MALTCILSLRQNDDGSGGDATTDDSRGDGEAAGGDAAATTGGAGAKAMKPRLNEGCERVIRFCSPTNVASTLTPAHFAQVDRVAIARHQRRSHGTNGTVQCGSLNSAG